VQYSLKDTSAYMVGAANTQRMAFEKGRDNTSLVSRGTRRREDVMPTLKQQGGDKAKRPHHVSAAGTHSALGHGVAALCGDSALVRHCRTGHGVPDCVSGQRRLHDIQENGDANYHGVASAHALCKAAPVSTTSPRASKKTHSATQRITVVPCSAVQGRAVPLCLVHVSRLVQGGGGDVFGYTGRQPGQPVGPYRRSPLAAIERVHLNSAAAGAGGGGNARLGGGTWSRHRDTRQGLAHRGHCHRVHFVNRVWVSRWCCLSFSSTAGDGRRREDVGVGV
jgi:hypothetical protein